MHSRSLVKFYASTPQGETNKLFKFKVNSQFEALQCILKLQKKGWVITAGWYETKRNSICGYTNTKIFTCKT